MYTKHILDYNKTNKIKRGLLFGLKYRTYHLLSLVFIVFGLHLGGGGLVALFSSHCVKGTRKSERERSEKCGEGESERKERKKEKTLGEGM